MKGKVFGWAVVACAIIYSMLSIGKIIALLNGFIL